MHIYIYACIYIYIHTHVYIYINTHYIYNMYIYIWLTCKTTYLKIAETMPFGMIPLTNHHSSDVTVRSLTVILIHPDGITVYIAIASEKVWEALVQRRRFQRRLQRRSWRRFWESLVKGQVRFNGFNRVSSGWLRSRVKIKRCGCWGYHRSLFFCWFIIRESCM